MESESTSVSTSSQDSNMDPCPVCKDLPFSEPVNISCGHMFCWSCLFVWFVNLGNKEPSMAPACPICKKETTVVHKAYGIPRRPRVDQLIDVPIPPWPEDDSWKSTLDTLLRGGTESNRRPRRRVLGNPRFDIYDVHFSDSDSSSEEEPGPPRGRGRGSRNPGRVRGVNVRGRRARGDRVRARGTRVRAGGGRLVRPGAGLRRGLRGGRTSQREVTGRGDDDEAIRGDVQFSGGDATLADEGSSFGGAPATDTTMAATGFAISGGSATATTAASAFSFESGGGGGAAAALTTAVSGFPLGGGAATSTASTGFSLGVPAVKPASEFSFGRGEATATIKPTSGFPTCATASTALTGFSFSMPGSSTFSSPGSSPIAPTVFDSPAASQTAPDTGFGAPALGNSSIQVILPTISLNVEHPPVNSKENSVDVRQLPTNGKSIFDFSDDDEELSQHKSILDHFEERNICLSPFLSPHGDNSSLKNHSVAPDAATPTDFTNQETDSFRDLFVSTCAAMNTGRGSREEIWRLGTDDRCSPQTDTPKMQLKPEEFTRKVIQTLLPPDRDEDNRADGGDHSQVRGQHEVRHQRQRPEPIENCGIHSEEPHGRLRDEVRGIRQEERHHNQRQRQVHQRPEPLDETYAYNGPTRRTHLQAHHGLDGADSENCGIHDEEPHGRLHDEGDRANCGAHGQHELLGVGQEVRHYNQRQQPEPLEETHAQNGPAYRAHQLQDHHGLNGADAENCGAPQELRHQPQLQHRAQRRHHKHRHEEEQHSAATQAVGEEAAEQHPGASFLPPLKRNKIPSPQPVSYISFNNPFSSKTPPTGKVKDEPPESPPANFSPGASPRHTKPSARRDEVQPSPTNLSPRNENSQSDDDDILDGLINEEDNSDLLPDSKKRFNAGAFLPRSNVTYLEVVSDVLRNKLKDAQVPWNKVNWFGVVREIERQYPGVCFGKDINNSSRTIQRRMNTAKKSYESGRPILPKKFKAEEERENKIREVWSDIINFLSQASRVAHRTNKIKRKKMQRRTLLPPSVGEIYQETPVVQNKDSEHSRGSFMESSRNGYRETNSSGTMGDTGGASIQNKGSKSVNNGGMKSRDGGGTNSREGDRTNSRDGGGVNSRDGGGVNSREGGGVNSREGGGVNSREGGGVNSRYGGGVNSRDGGGVNSRDGGGVNSRDGGGVNSRYGGGVNSTDGGGVNSTDGGGVNFSASQRMSPTARFSPEDYSESDEMEVDKRQKKRTVDGAHIRDSSLGTMIRRRTNNNIRISQEMRNLNNSLSDLSRIRQNSNSTGVLENFSKRLCDRSEERKREEDAEKREDRRIQLMILASLAGKNQNVTGISAGYVPVINPTGAGEPTEDRREIKLFKVYGPNITDSPEYPAVIKLNNINQMKEDISSYLLEDVSKVYAIAVHLNNGERYIITNVTQIKMSSATVEVKLKNNRKLIVLTEKV